MEYMRENFMGVEEVRGIVMGLQKNIDERLNDFEQKMEKKMEELQNTIIGRCKEDVNKKLSSIKETLMETSKQEKEDLKDEVRKSLEDGLFVLKKIDVIRTAQEDVDKDVSIISENQPEMAPRPQEKKQSTPKMAKVNWKDFPMQDDFLRREHENMGWKKNNTVKKSIFDMGLKRKLWNDDEVWRKRVCYKIDAQYKAHFLMSDTRSSPS